MVSLLSKLVMVWWAVALFITVLVCIDALSLEASPVPSTSSSASHVAIPDETTPFLLSRRSSFIQGINIVIGTWQGLSFSVPIAGATPTNSIAATTIFTDEFLQSLIYVKVLGKGSFKTVYQVASTLLFHDAANNQWALCVEAVLDKATIKDEVRGIGIAQQLEKLMMVMIDNNNKTDTYSNAQRFERVYDWWFQDVPPNTFVETTETKQLVFGDNSLQGKTQKVPGRFLGTKWLISLKPVYDMDLQRFCRHVPTCDYSRNGSYHPPQSTASTPSVANTIPPAPTTVVAGIPLNDTGALQLAHGIMMAGKLMHQVSLVHRDIKPKNIMLQQGQVVIIDFGFAQFVDQADQQSNNIYLCVEQAGRIKGEVGYVVAEDVAQYRGCTRGDAYAFGKTLYEVLFAPVAMPGNQDQLSTKQEITVEKAQSLNAQFRTELFSSDNVVNRCSRFDMSSTTWDGLLQVIRGLCRQDDPISLATAEQMVTELQTTATPQKQN